MLVGAPGVGKRTIVGALARLIAGGGAPQPLTKRAVVALDLPPYRVLDKDRSWQQEAR